MAGGGVVLPGRGRAVAAPQLCLPGGEEALVPAVAAELIEDLVHHRAPEAAGEAGEAAAAGAAAGAAPPCWGFCSAIRYTFPGGAFSLTACLRGPLRVRALVRVRWPRTGSPRR